MTSGYHTMNGDVTGEYFHPCRKFHKIVLVQRTKPYEAASTGTHDYKPGEYQIL